MGNELKLEYSGERLPKISLIHPDFQIDQRFVGIDEEATSGDRCFGYVRDGYF